LARIERIEREFIGIEVARPVEPGVERAQESSQAFEVLGIARWTMSRSLVART